jgi:hypothetical protein
MALNKDPYDTVNPKKKARKDNQSQMDQETMTSIDNSVLNREGFITYRQIQLELEKDNLFIALSQVFKYCKGMGIEEESSYVKPTLTEKHRKERLLFVLNKVDTTDPMNLLYKNHEDIVSIDEKWFRSDPLRKTLKYLPDHARHPNNTVQHKSHIPQLMITAAISEPTATFDGKVGLIYHGDEVAAERNSRRRPRGTLEIKAKNVDCEEFFDGQTRVDEDISKTGILDQIIRNKVPDQFTYIQMDNAPSHVGRHTKELLNEFCDFNNLMIEYTTQPAQSPDFHICDLALFNSLQKRVDRIKDQADKTLDMLWNVTKEVFDSYPKETIQICYGHLYANYNECLKHDGDNRHKNPHDGVRTKFARGEPLNRCCLTFEQYVHLKVETENWLVQHQ